MIQRTKYKFSFSGPDRHRNRTKLRVEMLRKSHYKYSNTLINGTFSKT